MTETAPKHKPSPATRTELRRIARTLYQARKNDKAAFMNVYLIVDNAKTETDTAGKIKIAVSPEALDYLSRLVIKSSEENKPPSHPGELTTQQAADRLGVSRPYLIKLLDAGKIPYRRVGHYRRIRRDDLEQFERADQARRRAGLEELAAFTQEIGLEY